jgi:hypothetical protein
MKTKKQLYRTIKKWQTPFFFTYTGLNELEYNVPKQKKYLKKLTMIKIRFKYTNTSHYS